MAWDDELVGTARNIAATTDTPLRVMAGPGTGKSFAMKRRVARLLEGGQNAKRILAVTFTRNAAASLVKDLSALGIPNCEKVKAGTLHALCFALLSRQDVFDYLGRQARPLVTFSKSGVLQFEANAMLADIAGGSFGPKRTCTKRIRAFEAAWARLQAENPGWPADLVDRQFQQALTEWLKFHEAILIGELVPEALRFLRNNPAAPDRNSYDHVIVDEFQDLNRAEQDLIDLLAGAGTRSIVGDVDQSIYRFRHANPDGITTYNASHPGTHDEVLDKCRRCPTRVVAMADSLIGHNHPTGGTPRLRPLVGNPQGEVHIVQWSSVQAETHGIGSFIAKLITDNRATAKDILVLTPRRLLAYALRDRLKALGVPVHSFYQEEALEENGAQRAFAILALLVNEEDRVALRWWLGEGSPSSRTGAYKQLRILCDREGISPKAALEGLIGGQYTQSGVSALITKYSELKACLSHLEGLSVSGVIDYLMPDGDPDRAVLREAALLSLPNCDEVEDLFEYLRNHTTQPEMPEEGEFVRIMSLHKSKGLTSKVVVILGCSQGLIPFEKPDETPQERAAILQEQRRLFYVALTRCTDILVVSSANQMARDFAWKIGARVAPGRSAHARTVASQFLDELGPNAPIAIQGQNWQY
jgi:DNA helicase-2/ATP-dependent DNA helicase PcrA